MIRQMTKETAYNCYNEFMWETRYAKIINIKCDFAGLCVHPIIIL